MAKYELPEFQSVYRDTGAVQVNQLKRQEYLANMQADNALSTSVMNMDALSKDQDKLENIAEKYNNNINQRSERKDYENLGMSINKDAMSFVKDYSPIKRQVDIRAGYKASLDEAVKAKRINQNTANLLLSESDYKYKGVEMTPTGTVNRDSFYTGSGFVNDVDVMALMQDQMKDFAVRTGEVEGFQLANENFEIIKEETEDKGVVYKYETTKGFKEIHPDDVAMIANKVLTRPEVIASMEQEARLGTFTSGEIAPGQVKSEAVNGIEENIKLSKKKLNQAKKELREKDLTADEKQTLEKKIVNLQKSIDFENDYLKSGKDPAEYYKAIKFNEIAAAHADYFVSKYSYRNEELKQDIKTFKTDEDKNEFNKHVPDTIITLDASEDLANTVSGGITIESILKTKSDNAAILTSIEEEFASSPGIVNTLTGISNEKEILELSKTLKDNNGNFLDINALRTKVAQAKRAQDNIRLLERRTKEAVASVFGDMVLPNGEIDQTKYTAYINNRYNNMQNPAKGRYTQSTEEASGPTADLYDGAAVLETLSYRDIRDAAIKAGLVPEGSDTKTVLDLLRDSEVVEGVPNPLDDDQKPTEIPSVANAIIDNIEGLTTGEGETPLWAAQDFINVVKQNYGEYELDNDKEVQKHLDNNEIKMLYTLSKNYGDPTAVTATGINNTIKGGLVDNTVVYAKGNSEPIKFHEWAEENDLLKTDKKGDIKKLLNEGFEIDTEKSGLITVANQSGEAMVAVGIKIKKTGQTKMVYMPAGQIDVFYKGKSPMREYINSTAFKLERLFNTGGSYNVESDTPNLPGGLQVRFNYANSERPIEITGRGEDKDKNSPTYGKIIEITKTYDKVTGLNLIERKLEGEKLQNLLH